LQSKANKKKIRHLENDSLSDEINYNRQGNIVHHLQVGFYEYDSSGPYAVKNVLPYSDEIPQHTQDITYNALMRPARMIENGDTAAFVYNTGGERVRMELRIDSTAQITRYYTGQYEIEENSLSGNTERLYLGGDAYSASAVYVRNGAGAWSVYYICRDYLGSITHVTDNTGALLQELSYDPWGRLRSPDTQILYAVGEEPALLLGRGYTGHEHLPWFGLINMNARLYDPVLGRFLSPDPSLQDPFLSQNFNR
jgi:RHS repeat-associated protein